MEEKLSEKELLEIAVKLFCAYPSLKWAQAHAGMDDYSKYATDLADFFTTFYESLRAKLKEFPEVCK